MASGMGRRQADGGNVIFWVMFCWETFSPAIYVDVALICTIYLNTVADPVQWSSLMVVASFTE